MNPIRNRTLIDAASTPALPGHVRLQFDGLRERWVVLAPERVHWPDDISIDILRRCDGKTPAGRIAVLLAKDYNAPLPEVESDVFGFLQEWSDKLLIRCGA